MASRNQKLLTVILVRSVYYTVSCIDGYFYSYKRNKRNVTLQAANRQNEAYQ